MCSLTHNSNPFKIHFANNLTIATNNADNMIEWCTAFNLLARLLAYVSVLAVMVLVIFLILKYITDFVDDDESFPEEIRASEANPLRPGKAMACCYGTCDRDIESGYCSTSSSGGASSSSSSMELYDGKLCVICYDEERNCFFVPCGHCATCYVCARRIFEGDNRVCPVCRRYIGKVRKLFAS